MLIIMISSAQKAQSVATDKQEDSEPIPEYFPPLPIYPPEGIQIIQKKAINIFLYSLMFLYKITKGSNAKADF